MTALLKSKLKTILVTAGPTIEDIDPVRFISNRSSGRLGIEIANVALRSGSRVILIHGPISDTVLKALPHSKRLTLVPVRSAAQMYAAVMRHVPAADAVIMNAAVADYTPVKVSQNKQKKAARTLTLRLKPTVDILAKLGERKRTHQRGLVLVGFALETGTGKTPTQRRASQLAEARRKLTSKNLDAIVLNTPDAMGTPAAEFLMMEANGKLRYLRQYSKTKAARAVIKLVSQTTSRESS